MTAQPVTHLRPVDAPAPRTLPTGFAWEEPPAPANGYSRKGKYADLAAVLRGNPGDWALIKTYPSDQKKNATAFATRINSGHLKHLEAGFQGRSRTIDGQSRVYVRYVGTTKEA